MAASRPPLSPAARWGRRIAGTLFYGSVSLFCLVITGQITRQVFYGAGTQSAPASCDEGLRSLAKAVDHARSVAGQISGEQAALDAFRGALRPAWDEHAAVAVACKQNAADKRALDAIERLRYAEEHAVRVEAADLSKLRKQVQEMRQGKLQNATPADHQ